jgi:ferredoxin
VGPTSIDGKAIDRSRRTGGVARVRLTGQGRQIAGMKVWIDQDLCTGDGLCEEIAPAVFTLLDDGLAYVKEGDEIKNDPGGSAGMALVPDDLEESVVEASEECPGECIFIERD